MNADYKCVETHRQGVSKPRYKDYRLSCDTSHVSKQSFPIEAVRDSVRRLMEEQGDKPKPLAAKLGLSETGIRDIFLEKTKSVGGPKLSAIAQHYGVSVEDILAGTATTSGRPFIPQTNAKTVQFEGASLERVRDDLPVFGTALGAEMVIEGERIEQTMLNTGDIIEYRKRPPISHGVEKVYGLYVQGASMYPAHRDGAFLFAQRDARLRVDDDVVVYLRPKDESDDGDRAVCVLVKRLVKRSAQFVELEQYNPARIFRIDMADVLRIDRVLTADDYT
ncbi:helix-turn-helix transcriptional regulator [Sphingobium sp. TCM1]|uniref:helix-turn-helix transcriptional regulator n=1 Tax=Sphingobium sp. TCM1 TaxID=453246 RepID=UPI0018DB9D41|nr:helix-turn-helix transcriptional regulator [Sphingobium sp. TCM1]